jgi:hypothetical protein
MGRGDFPYAFTGEGEGLPFLGVYSYRPSSRRLKSRLGHGPGCPVPHESLEACLSWPWTVASAWREKPSPTATRRWR